VEAIDRGIAELDLRKEFEADGTSYSELDEDGNVVTRNPRPVEET